MPRKPLHARRSSTARVALEVSAIAAGGALAIFGNTVSASAPQLRFSAAQKAALCASPSAGISQKADTRTPSTAPRVLIAYSSAIDRPLSRTSAVSRSIAGSVAPMAAVAGKNRQKQAANTTNQCQAADGATPIVPSTQPLKGDATRSSSKLQPAINNSQPAYQRTGRALCSMRSPRSKPPSASPPKNAASTANTPADSWPSHSEHCSLQTI